MEYPATLSDEEIEMAIEGLRKSIRIISARVRDGRVPKEVLTLTRNQLRTLRDRVRDLEEEKSKRSR